MIAGCPTVAQVREARQAIAGAAIRTPLVRLHASEAPAEIYLNLENLQLIGSFKIRSAANAIAHMTAAQLECGVVTASAGNMAQGVAWRARELGIPCTVIAPDSAPQTKISAIERLGGRVLKVSFDEAPNSKPLHALADYVADYENPAYGIMKIALKDNQLQFDFHKMHMPMTQFHYDRFNTPDDERDGKWSVNFRTNPQGDVDQAVMSLDEAEAVFTRKPEALDATLLTQLAGTYEMPSGMKAQIENGQVKALKEKDPSGEFSYPRK